MNERDSKRQEQAEALENPKVKERLHKITSEHERKQRALEEAARNGIPSALLDTVTPDRLILEGVGKVVGGTVLDMADEMIGLNDPATEYALDQLIAFTTEQTTNRKLRTSLTTKVIGQIGNMPKTLKYLSTLNKVNPNAIGRIQKVRNLIPRGLEFLDSKMDVLKTKVAIGGSSLFPIIQGVVSETSIDGFRDIWEGCQALKSGEKRILVERLRPTDTTFNYPVNNQI